MMWRLAAIVAGRASDRARRATRSTTRVWVEANRSTHRWASRRVASARTSPWNRCTLTRLDSLDAAPNLGGPQSLDVFSGRSVGRSETGEKLGCDLGALIDGQVERFGQNRRSNFGHGHTAPRVCSRLFGAGAACPSAFTGVCSPAVSGR